MDASVTAFVINFNGGERLLETVRDLRASDYPGLELVVVDCASTDGSAERAENEFRGLSCWRLGHNPGYGEAFNQAARRSFGGGRPPDYLLLANNDIRPAQDMVSSLVAEAIRRGPGVVGPQVLRADDPTRLEAAWGRVRWDHVAARFEGKGAKADLPQWNTSREVEVLLGTVLLIHRAVLEAVGGFDPDFFMYHEEIDFLHRVGRAGFPVVYCPKARVEHVGGHASLGDPGFKLQWTRRNALLLLRKHKPGAARWCWWAATLGGSLLWNLVSFRFRRFSPILRGVRDGWSAPLSFPGSTPNGVTPWRNP